MDQPIVDPIVPPESFHDKAERVLTDSDLMWTLFGLELTTAGILAYLGFILLAVIGAIGGGLVLWLLAAVVAVLAILPRWRPMVLDRLGLPNPFAQPLTTNAGAVTGSTIIGGTFASSPGNRARPPIAYPPRSTQVADQK
jgi:hypothetical protein